MHRCKKRREENQVGEKDRKLRVGCVSRGSAHMLCCELCCELCCASITIYKCRRSYDELSSHVNGVPCFPKVHVKHSSSRFPSREGGTGE